MDKSKLTDDGKVNLKPNMRGDQYRCEGCWGPDKGEQLLNPITENWKQAQDLYRL